MKSLEQLNLKKNDKKALQELKQRLLERFPDLEITIYGSRARGDYEQFSDIDLLILLDLEVNTPLEDEIIGLAYDIELKYDVVFGLLIESKSFWNSPLANAMPIHWNIDREGITV
jgi:predicted nucleotidyltransferase